MAQTCACRDAEIKELASKLAHEMVDTISKNEEKKQQQKKKVAKEKSKATKAKRKKIKHWRPEVLDEQRHTHIERLITCLLILFILNLEMVPK